MNNLLLPSSVPTHITGTIFHDGIEWIKIYCANCGCDGGMVPEETKKFAFYLCDPCGAKWEPLANTMLVPDEVFWEKVKTEQLERYGRELQPFEVVEALKDDNHILSKLARDRYK